MTPKQKAKELVEKYEKYIFNRFTTDEDWVKCVECALIAVDEIIEIEPYKRRFILFEKARFNDQTQYWKEVKEEIEKL
jgi:hypothetical protein